MDRIIKIIFYGCLGLFVAFVMYLTVVMYISPRQDMQKRGFIPCTETLVYNITSCEAGKIRCPLKYLWQDIRCNVRVIANGFGQWVKGTQPRPWSNYLFVPVTEETENEIYVGSERAEDTYDQDATALFIATKQQELEAAKDRKINADESVILNNPEELNKIADDLQYLPNKTKAREKGDIGDEVPTEAEMNRNAVKK